MSNLIPLEDAARMLGLSVDKLNEMRSNSEIFGYKDGTSWKFKMQEIERVADEIGVTLGSADADQEIVELADDGDNDDDMLFELSDSGIDLGIDPTGEKDDVLEIADDDKADDLEIAVVEDDAQEVVDIQDEEESVELSFAEDDGEEDLAVVSESENEDSDLGFSLADEDSAELTLASDGDDALLQIADDEELSLGSSDINLAGGDDDDVSGTENTGDLLGSRIDDPSISGSGPATGDLLADEQEEDSGLLLSEDDLFDDDLKIHESHEDDIDLSSDFESGDLFVEDSASSEGSAVIDAEDSGFVLDDDSSELDLSGSLLDSASGDDDEMIVLDEPDAQPSADADDDDFNLTPLEEVVDEDSSGSQIIALEDSEMFSEESASTMLSAGDEVATPMLTEDGGIGDFVGFDQGVAAMDPAMAMTPTATGSSLPEQPYTIAQLGSLGVVVVLLVMGAIIGFDLARNLWYPGGQTVSTGLLPLVLELVGY